MKQLIINIKLVHERIQIQLSKKKSEKESFKLVLRTNLKEITSKIASTLGGIPFVPKSLDFVRNIAGQILPLFCQINYADMPAIQGFPTNGMFQLYITKDMSEYDLTKQSWMMIEPNAKNFVGTKAAYKVKAAHTIGGKPNFTQQPDYTDCVNFLQFDSSDGVMIGDCGIMHIFIKKEDLEELNFEKAIFYFDC
ncbi:Conserved_hypothetical protein [Hexamita inflata]|uniref:Uncharacterized protein n=1 Tax=Hexamita inflata TaxID=28002 RepID=A0AA86QER4_9EUKA|nr:Conserved hypothetical protein [Hexamita inflata]